MTILKRILRLLRLVVLVVLALAIGAVAVFTLTERGRDNLATLISTMASSGDAKVRIGGLGGIWAGPLTVDHVVLEDADGTWLVVRGVEIDWSPFALFSSTFKADRVFAKRLEVARLPRSSGKGGGGGGLPVSLAVKQIDLPDIALGEEIAGGVAQLSARGSLDVLAAPLKINTGLRIARIDGVGGNLDASIRFVPSEKELDVSIRGSEPAGGILANLLELPGAPPVSIQVSGSGPAADWMGSGTFAADGTPVTSVFGRHRIVEGGSLIEVRGDGEFARFLPARLQPLLAGRADFDIAALLGTAGRVDVERANLQSAAIRASARGALDPQGASDFALAAAGPVSLSFGATSVSLTKASVRVLGPGKMPTIDVTASLDRVAVEGNELRDIEAVLHSDGFDVAKRSGPVEIELAAASVTTNNPTLAPLVAGQVRASATGAVSDDAIRIEAGSVGSGAVAVRLSGEISRPDFALTMTVAADVASSALPAAARTALGERVELSGTISRNAAGDISADSLKLVSGDLSADGNATLSGDTIEAALKGAFANVGRLAQGATGAVTFSLGATGKRDAPDLSLTIASDRIEAAGREITGLEMTASGAADFANPAAKVSLKGSFAGETLAGTADLTTSDGRREVKGLSIGFGQSRISGDLVLGEDFLPEGTVDFSVPDIGQLAALAEQEAKGEAKGKIRFTRANGVPGIVIDATASTLSRAEVTAREVAVNATFSDYLGTPSIAGRIKAASVAAGTIVANNIDGTFEQSGDRVSVAIRAAEPAGGTLSTLMGLPGSRVVDLSVSGSGPAADWKGDGTVAIDGTLVTTVSGTHRTVDNGRWIELDGDGGFERFLPAGLRSLLAGKTDFDIAGVLGAAGRIEVERANVESPAFRASARGTVDPQGANDFALEAEAVAGQVPLAFGAGAQAVSISLEKASMRMFGPGPAPMLDIAASLDRVAADGNELRNIEATLHSDEFDVTKRTGPAAIDLTVGSVTTDNATLAPLVAGHVRAGATTVIFGDAVRMETGTVTSDAFTARLSGEISRPDFTFALAVEADSAASALPAAARRVLGERVVLSGRIRRDAAGDISADSIRLASGDLSADGNVALTGDIVEATLKGAFGNVGRLAQGATGAVAFSLDATGRAATPNVSVTVTSDSIQAAGREITGLELTASGTADLADPAAKVSLKGDVSGQALTATADLTTSDGRREVKGLSIGFGQSRISGDLMLGEDFLPEGTLDFSVPDIGQLAALAEQEAQGEAQGKISFTRANGVPGIVVDAVAPSLSRTEVTAKEVAVNATLSDYLGTPVIAGRIKAASVAAGTIVANNIDGTLEQSADRLSVAIRAAEPAGGTLSTLMGLPGSRVVDLSVSGSGPVADWKGEGTVAIDGALVTTVSGTHRIVDGGGRIEVKGDGEFERLAPVELRSLLAGKTDFDIAGLLGTSGKIEVERANVQSPAIRVSATGAVDPQGANDFVLQAEAVAGPVPLAFEAGAQAVSMSLETASVRVFGPGNESMVDIAASLDRVAVDGNELRNIAATLHSDGFDVATRTGPVAIDLTVGSVVTNNTTLASLVAGQVKASATAAVSQNAISIEAGSLSSDALAVRLSGEISRPDFAFTTAVAADVASSALPAATQAALGERVELSGTINRNAAGDISADSLKLASGDLSADGNAALSGDTIEAAVNGAFANVGRLAQGASGAVNFSLGATGKRDAPDLTLTVASDRIEAAGREITGLELTATGAADFANPAAKVLLKGNVAGQALTGSAELRTAADRREVGGLSIMLGQNRISGDLVLDDSFVPEGSVDLSVPDIGPLAALALEEVKGDIRGKIRFTRMNGVPGIVVDAATSRLSRADLAARDVAVAATVSDYLGTPVIAGKVRAASVASGATVISDIDVTLTREGMWTGFGGGAKVNAMPAKAAGRFKIDNGETVIELASGEATVSGLKVALARATTVVVRDGRTVLDKLPLTISGGSVVVSGTAGQTLALDIQLNTVRAAVANTFSPGLNATGTISGSARLSGPASKPEVGYTIRWANAGTAQTSAAGFGAMAITSSGTFSGSTLKFEANVTGGAGLGLKGGGTVATAGTPTLNLDFSGRVPFAFLTRRLAAQGLSFTGSADVNVQVRGPATAPAINGTVRTSGARFVDSGSGIAINHISADVSLGGGVATLRSLTGKISTGGSLSAKGTVGIDAAKGFPADLSVKIVDGRYTDGRVVTTTLNGDLALKGSLVGTPTLSGTINLGRTVITVPERLPGSLASLDVRHKNAPRAVIAQERAIRPAEAKSGGGGGGGLNLDVTVNAPRQIFVQGRGLDAELGGSVRLTGAANAPHAIGEFTMRRGRLSLLGRRLTFERGTLDFAGSVIPNLDLAADSTVSGTTITVLVTGPATNPKFTFQSVPALPEDEVLARLIFGRSMSNLSPLQIAQLAEAAAQLAGVGGPTSLLGSLRSRIGIDDLDVTTDEEGNAAVSAGRYLNDRTYVTIERGEKASSGKATINLDVGRGIKLSGSAREDGEAKGGIFFEREY